MKLDWILLSFLYFGQAAHSIKVYQSTLPIETEHGDHGLIYKGEKRNVPFNNGFTLCVRFCFKRLNSYLFYLESFIRIAPHFKKTWFIIGNMNDGTGHYASWLLINPKTQDPVLWYANQWHHICTGYDGENVSFVKVLKQKYYL